MAPAVVPMGLWRAHTSVSSSSAAAAAVVVVASTLVVVVVSLALSSSLPQPVSVRAATSYGRTGHTSIILTKLARYSFVIYERIVHCGFRVSL